MLKRAGLFAPLLTSLVIGLFAFPRPAQACSCVTPDPTPAALCRRTQYFGERQPARPILADGGGTNYGGGCLARTLVFWFAAMPRQVHRWFHIGNLRRRKFFPAGKGFSTLWHGLHKPRAASVTKKILEGREIRGKFFWRQFVCASHSSESVFCRCPYIRS